MIKLQSKSFKAVEGYRITKKIISIKRERKKIKIQANLILEANRDQQRLHRRMNIVNFSDDPTIVEEKLQSIPSNQSSKFSNRSNTKLREFKQFIKVTGLLKIGTNPNQN